jgi:hypothetical protein
MVPVHFTNKTACLAAATGFLLSLTAAWAGSVGTTTADILKINQGAKPAAMGGAYTAMGDDAYSINYNPAGLAQIRASQAVVLHLESLADIAYEYLTFATEWGGGNVLAANLTYRHSPPIDNQNGNPPVTADDVLGCFSFAKKFADNLRVGATLKYLQSTLANISASTVALDVGVQLDKLPFGCRAGLAVQNLSPGMSFDPAEPSEALPMFIRGGLGTRQMIFNREVNIGAEVFKPSDQGIKVGAGAEVWLFPELFAIRGGYKFDWAEDKELHNVFQNYCLGGTLTRRLDDNDFSVDFAYNPADFTSTTQDTFFFALNVKFNQFRIF